MKFRDAQPLCGSTSIIDPEVEVALQPEKSPGGMAARLWG